MGFYFGGPTNPQAGWAEIETTLNGSQVSAEILDYAYQSVGNTSILAGQTATPEPSTLSLIVLGGAGLIALRRRRASNA
jgi:hypothetical protein